MCKEYELWDIVKSNSKLENFDVNVLVRGYQIEMMKVCNYMMIMHRNI
jgi:hypothetical protein